MHSVAGKIINGEQNKADSIACTVAPFWAYVYNNTMNGY